MKQGFDNIRRYTEIERNITKLKVQLLLLLEKIKKEGKSVAVYSAPAKGNILLNFFGIKKFLDFIVDKAKEKQGLYTPGTHFRVYPPEKIFREKPDYLLILCWNIAEEVISQSLSALVQALKLPDSNPSANKDSFTGIQTSSLHLKLSLFLD